jgi:hypothetical protein
MSIIDAAPAGREPVPGEVVDKTNALVHYWVLGEAGVGPGISFTEARLGDLPVFLAVLPDEIDVEAGTPLAIIVDRTVFDALRGPEGKKDPGKVYGTDDE